MRGPRFYVWTDEGDLCPWDLAEQAPVSWHDCAFWREVFRALDGLLATSDLDIVLTRNVTGEPPLTGDQIVVVVINDEFGLLPPWAHQVGLVAKTMGGASRPLSVRLRSREDILYSPLTLAQEMAVQAKRVRHRARSAWKGRAGRARVLDVPLGIHLLQPGPLTPFDERPVDVSFAGSLGNSEREAARRIPSQKVRARRRLYAAVEASRRTQPHLCIRTSQLLSFHWAHDHVDSYTALMSATKVALCPRGSVWETYRWWEAMASGCVVVAERQRSADYYRDAPAVVVDGWTRLPDVLRSLFSDPAGLRERAEASLRFWHAQGAPAAVAGRICQAHAREARTPAPVV